jgi:endonuclease/exonuclease/phosphatase family metal-dependent hydrolase
MRLCRLPERRWVHAVRIDGPLWIANLHATVHNDRAARRDSALAAATVAGWAGGEPAILGGDFNVRRLALEGFQYAGGHDVDLVFVSSAVRVAGEAQVLDRGRLSDHAPVAIEIEVGRNYSD